MIQLEVYSTLHRLRLQNDLYCVEWGVKLYSLTHLQFRVYADCIRQCSNSSGRNEIIVDILLSVLCFGHFLELFVTLV